MVSDSADNTTDAEESSTSDDEVLDLNDELQADDESSDGEEDLRETIQTDPHEQDSGDGSDGESDEVPPSSVATPREPMDPPAGDEEPFEPEPLEEPESGAETVEEDSLRPEDHEQGPVTVHDREDPAPEESDADVDGVVEPEPLDESEVSEVDPIEAEEPGDEPAGTEPAGEQDEDVDTPGGPPGEVYETVQMEAIDRTAIEREGQMRQLEQTLPLLSGRFAPEIVVGSPNNLVEGWGAGLPELAPGPEPEELEPDQPGEDAPEAAPPETPPEDLEGSVPEGPPEGETSSSRPPPAEGLGDEGSKPEPPKKARSREQTPQSPPQVAPETEPGSNETPAIGSPVADEAPEPGEGEGTSDARDEVLETDEKDEELSEIVDELVEGDEGDEAGAEDDPPLSGNWVQQVFGELYLATVPDAIDNRTEREVDFIEESFELDEEDNILDLACGFGRHTIELVARNYDVVGFDLSKPLLKEALQKAKQQSLEINFFHGDMRNLEFEQVFDACFCWQSSFGYFEDAVNLDVLARVNRALNPDGTFLMDVMNRDYVIRKMPHRIWWEGRDCLLLEEGEFDFDKSVLHMNRSFIYEDGRPPIEQDWYIRLYSPHELRQILSKAGFEVTELSGAIHYRGDFIGRDSPKLIARADKVKALG